ncbi:peptide chain release factor N(5)-glutamine methyltransferase [Paludibacterium paludis]|uniref:peptide chain release factor N(5)-glutamine methyltransferase n=1 Tax=Paludibacterium paludis TaxID=1225769 RepID=UPI00357149CB
MTLDGALGRYPLPRLEARMLLMHAMPGLTHAHIVGHGEEVLPPEAEVRFAGLAGRRLAGEPMAYLIGVREFFGRDFRVTPDVLIPRPDTEILVEAALERAKAGGRVVDLGTGSGAIAVTLALEGDNLDVWAVDVSAAALSVARGNAATLEARVHFVEGSWYDGLPADACFDIIVSNPPYIAHDDHHLQEGDVAREPRLALTDGADGLRCLAEIAQGARARLAPDGWLLVEHGFDQGEGCRALFVAAGLRDVVTLKDLAGHDRVTLGRSG